MEETKIHQVNPKYRIIFEQAASTKGVIGFKVKVNGDDLDQVSQQAEALLEWAMGKASNMGTEIKQCQK